MPGSTQQIVERLVKVRVIDPNARYGEIKPDGTTKPAQFYINGQVAVPGQTYEVSLTDAHALREHGRVEILDEA